MQLTSLLARFPRTFVLFGLTFAALCTLPSAVHAQTAADLTPAALVGKKITCTIVGGNSPFETSGSFTLELDSTGPGRYTISASSGNATARAGTYTTTSGPDFINIRLNGYLVNNSVVEIELYPIGNATATAQSDAGRTYFEMFGGPANKRGTFTIQGLTPGGGGGTTTSIPVISLGGQLTATVGVPFTYQITTVPGTSAATSYEKSGGDPAFSVNATTGLVSASLNTVGTVSLGFTATNSAGTSPVTTITVIVRAATTGANQRPVITSQPATQSVAAGGNVTLTVVAAGTGNTYQWRFNGVPIAGATADRLGIIGSTAANAGSYDVAVTNSFGTTITSSATLTVRASTVVPPSGTSGAYLSNLSIRSTAGSGPQTLIVGVTIGGTDTVGSKNVLIRGIGPSLAAFGVPGTLADPKLEVFSNASPIALTSNDDWSATATPAATQASVGAFALAPGSKDAALVGANTPAGGYSVQITGVGGATGVALAEIYDLTPAAAFTATTPRLINISARTQVGTGDDILITGFNLIGNGQRRLLIRAVGPTLAAFGVTGTLADPKLDVFAAGATTPISSNDNWDSTATPLATQTGAGAFPLTVGSKDAVLIISLSPGSYTAQVSGIGATTGVALVEIYELP